MYLPDGLEVIESHWFSTSAVGSIFIFQSVTQICDNAFDGCSLLKEITFAKESRLKRINAYAFLNSSIEAFLAPDSLKEIGIMAFCKRHELSLVQLNNCLESIGELASWGAKIKNLKLPR